MKIIARIRLTATQIEELRTVFDELARLEYQPATLAQLHSNAYGEIEILVGVLESERAQQVQAIVAPERVGYTTPVIFPYILTTAPPVL